MKKLLFILCILSISSSVGAQDPVFSQYYTSPLFINPAFSGIALAPKISLNYRNQYPGWPNAYSTFAAAYEQPIENLNSSLGLIVMGDAAGNGLLKTNRVSGIFGYQVRVNNGLAIKFGVEAGIIQSSIDWDRLVFVDQLDPRYGQEDQFGNPLISEELIPESLTKVIPDISVGMIFYTSKFYGAIGVKHLNSPDESLLALNPNLNLGIPIAFSLQAGGQIILQEGNNRRPSTFLSPNLLFIKQGALGQINGGAYAGFGKFFAGLWYRHTFSNPDAIIGLFGFRYGVMKLGYSYDITISKLSTVEGGTGGTHEISLSFNLEDSEIFKRKRRNSRYSDCFKIFR